MKIIIKLLFVLVLLNGFAVINNADAQITTRGKIVKAIKAGDVDRIEELVAKNKKINTGMGFFNNNTLLGEVINANISQHDKIAIIRILHESLLIDLNEEMYTKDGSTYPIIASIKETETQVAEALIALNALIDVQDENMSTPLSEAIKLVEQFEKVNFTEENNAIILTETIIKKFPYYKQEMDAASAVKSFRTYVVYSINECISKFLFEPLKIILSSPLTDENLISYTLGRAIAFADNSSKGLKTELIKMILTEINNRNMSLDRIRIENIDQYAWTYFPNQEIYRLLPGYESPMALAIRVNDPISTELLTNAGANIEEQEVEFSFSHNNTTREIVTTSNIAKRYNSKEALNIIQNHEITLEKALLMLQKFNHGFASTDFEEQMSAATSHMIVVGEYTIRAWDIDLLFGPENEYGIRTGGVYDYMVKNPGEGQNWAYIALFGALCTDNTAVSLNRDMFGLIVKGYYKTGLINLSSYTIVENLKVKNLVFPGMERTLRKNMDIIKTSSSKAITK